MRANVLSELTPELFGGSTPQLETYLMDGDHVMEGALRWGDGLWAPIVDGVPSFLTGVMRADLTGFAARHGLPRGAAWT